MKRLLRCDVDQFCKVMRSAHTWKSQSIRSSFISFYGEKGHSFVPASPVVPWNDESINFVNAGMNQFKPVLLGEKKIDIKRAVNSQKCIRVGGKHNDLLDVGRDTYHHTFFEMLGSWSFNDYFKEEACRMSWELLTQVFKIPPQHLYVTYFGGDDSVGLKPDEESKQIWLSLGVPADRVLPFGMKDNFWEMGAVGPCGPCTEIHYERIPSSGGASKVNLGHEDVIEIWNLVFMQYQRIDTGELRPLASRFVDTGMGLERLTACLNGKWSNYDTDVFCPLFEEIQKMSKMPSYKGKFSQDGNCLDTAYRILADHSRMVSIALSDGLLPHDSYHLRRAIRRCMLIGWNQFGLQPASNFMGNLLRVVTDQLGEVFPELVINFDRTKSLLEYEEHQLLEGRRQVSREWSKLLETYPSLANLTAISPKLIEGVNSISPYLGEWKCDFPLEEALKLHHSYFLSPELIEDIALAFGLRLDVDILNKELLKARKVVHSNSSAVQKRTSPDNIVKILCQNSVPVTDDSAKYNYSYEPEKGYSFPGHQSIILCNFVNGQIVEKMDKGCRGVVILDSTNFYPKSGGQASDTGIIEDDGNIFKVFKVERLKNYTLHFGEVLSGAFYPGLNVISTINEAPRLSAAKLHTAHHLIRRAIEEVAGMSYQRTSTVTEKKLLMDAFVYPLLRLEQLIQAENLVKEWIKQTQPVSRKTLPLFEALRENVTLVSGEKYPDDVRLITTSCDMKATELNSFSSLVSSELCCGTHVYNTGHLEDFSITEFKQQGKNVIRIGAVTGKEATKLNTNGEVLRKDFTAWNERITKALENNERLLELSNDFKKWKRDLKKSSFPITVFNDVDGRGNRLIESMDEILVHKSNWRELRMEFQDHLSCHPIGAVVYVMKTDYRGSINNLEIIMQEMALPQRPLAFVCKGWGRVRVCVYIPQNLENDVFNLEKVLSDLEQVVGGQINRKSQDIGTLYIQGVKRERLVETIEQIKEYLLECTSQHRCHANS